MRIHAEKSTIFFLVINYYFKIVLWNRILVLHNNMQWWLRIRKKPIVYFASSLGNLFFLVLSSIRKTLGKKKERIHA